PFLYRKKSAAGEHIFLKHRFAVYWLACLLLDRQTSMMAPPSGLLHPSERPSGRLHRQRGNRGQGRRYRVGYTTNLVMSPANAVPISNQSWSAHLRNNPYQANFNHEPIGNPPASQNNRSGMSIGNYGSVSSARMYNAQGSTTSKQRAEPSSSFAQVYGASHASRNLRTDGVDAMHLDQRLAVIRLHQMKSVSRRMSTKRVQADDSPELNSQQQKEVRELVELMRTEVLFKAPYLVETVAEGKIMLHLNGIDASDFTGARLHYRPHGADLNELRRIEFPPNVNVEARPGDFIVHRTVDNLNVL
ncbi:hypothetical protein GE09DRAFT_1254787, partial [Coniochaeta sp. 2T2.1]